MGALLMIAALAQAGTAAGGPSTSTSADAIAPIVNSGESNYLDLEAGAGYSSNPTSSLINDAGSAFGRISAQGVHSHVSERRTTLLSGFVENISYTNHGGSQQLVDVTGSHQVAISEHARLFFDGTASYDENGQLGTRVIGLPLLPPTTPGGPVTPPILVIPGDFLSITGRTYTVSGHAGGTFALGPRDSLSLSSGVEHTVFHGGATRTNYTTVPASIAYDRQLSTRTTVGARVTFANTDYSGPANFRTITPQVTGRTLLSPNVTLDGAVGVSFARINDGLIIRNTTGLSAQARLCGRGETSYYCARFSADEQAATTAGPARTISGDIDYSKRLDANQTVSFSLGVTRYASPISVLVGRSFSSATYYRAAAEYSRRVGRRLFAGANLAALKLTQNGPDPKTDFSASLFIRYRLGDVQ